MCPCHCGLRDGQRARGATSYKSHCHLNDVFASGWHSHGEMYALTQSWGCVIIHWDNLSGGQFDTLYYESYMYIIFHPVFIFLGEYLSLSPLNLADLL